MFGTLLRRCHALWSRFAERVRRGDHALSRARHDDLQHLLFVSMLDVPITDIFAALQNHDTIAHCEDIDQTVRYDNLSDTLPLQLKHGLKQPNAIRPPTTVPKRPNNTGTRGEVRFTGSQFHPLAVACSSSGNGLSFHVSWSSDYPKLTHLVQKDNLIARAGTSRANSSSNRGRTTKDKATAGRSAQQACRGAPLGFAHQLPASLPN